MCFLPHFANKDGQHMCSCLDTTRTVLATNLPDDDDSATHVHRLPPAFMAKDLRELNAARPYFIAHGKERTLPAVRATPGSEPEVQARTSLADMAAMTVLDHVPYTLPSLNALPRIALCVRDLVWEGMLTELPLGWYACYAVLQPEPEPEPAPVPVPDELDDEWRKNADYREFQAYWSEIESDLNVRPFPFNWLSV